jgi:uncharacterized LabA/DUF88 family protein
VDRCALFVDAGYVLADGAMAVHGTRRRESVSWDYAGLLQLLASLAQERSGLPLLRCYWYEATVEGRRNADHDTLADLPGVKLRVAKMRPGRREGVESEIHRDLTTLARNKAVSDAMVVSAEEDLAQVIADVQDLGLRVSLLHIVVDGNWTISRTLRQECDDIVEVTNAHLRPYVELISGAEPPRPDERDGAPLIALRSASNGHGPVGRTAAYDPAPAGGDNGYQAPPSIYTAPVVAEYQRSAPQLSRSRPDDRAAAREDSRSDEPAVVQEPPSRPDLQPVRNDAPPTQGDPLDALAEPAAVDVPEYLAPQEPAAAQPESAPVQQEAQPAMPDYVSRPDPLARQEIYAAPVVVPAPAEDQPIELPVARSRQAADLSGYTPGAVREQLPRDAVIREPLSRDPLPGEAGEGLQPVPAAANSAQIRRLPTRGGQPMPGPGQPVTGAPTAAQPVLSAPTGAPPAPGQQPMGPQPMGQPAVQPAAAQPAAPVMPIAPGAGYAVGRNGSYSGPRPVIPPGPPAAGPGGPVGLAGQPAGSGAQPGPTPLAPVSPAPLGANGPIGAPGQGTAAGAPAGPAGPVGPAAYSGGQPSVSLAEAVQSAHEEGQAFGESVARDAPALWLEAVLARKPRMPSDLEARLLQGSSLPIDFLLHDEVRHALRRGFWDALERTRR